MCHSELWQCTAAGDVDMATDAALASCVVPSYRPHHLQPSDSRAAPIALDDAVSTDAVAAAATATDAIAVPHL